jgi:hypothetical protein
MTKAERAAHERAAHDRALLRQSAVQGRMVLREFRRFPASLTAAAELIDEFEEMIDEFERVSWRN